MVVVAMMARLRNAGRDGYREHDGGGGEKLHFGHLDSPQNLAGKDKFGRCWLSFSAERCEKLREISHTTPIFGP
jgi:hypothetical protein